MSNLTINFLISRDVDSSGDVCCDDVNEGSGAVWHIHSPLVVQKQVLLQRVRLGPKSLGRG